MERRTGGIKGATLLGMGVVLMITSAKASACEMVTLEKAAYGPFGGRACIVANSAGSWRQAMKALEHAGALAILPAPDAPADVDWSRESVVLVAAGATGYDIRLTLTPSGHGKCKVSPEWIPIADHDGGESLPYHLVKLPKHMGLKDMAAQGSAVENVLPLIGDDVSVAAGTATWGHLKASYR